MTENISELKEDSKSINSNQTCLRFSYSNKDKIDEIKNSIKNNFNVSLNQPAIAEIVFSFVNNEDFIKSLNKISIKIPTENYKLTTFVLPISTKNIYDSILRRFENIDIIKGNDDKHLLLTYKENDKQIKHNFTTDQYIQIILELYKTRNILMLKENKQDQIQKELNKSLDKYKKINQSN